MSILQCDVCKNILEEPVTLPCGYSICAKHANQFIGVPCSLCKDIHHDPSKINLKLSRLINILDRAKTACSRLQTDSATYNDLKIRPLDTINTRFEKLKTEVLAEKDRILRHVQVQVETRTKECLSHIEDWLERCVSSLEVKSDPSFYTDLVDVNSKIDEFKKILQSDKVSEDIWDKIIQNCDQMDEEIKKKTVKLKEQYFLNTTFSFQPQFNYNQPINIGMIMTSSENHNNGSSNTSQPIESFSPFQPNMTPQSFSSSTSISTQPQGYQQPPILTSTNPVINSHYSLPQTPSQTQQSSLQARSSQSNLANSGNISHTSPNRSTNSNSTPTVQLAKSLVSNNQARISNNSLTNQSGVSNIAKTPSPRPVQSITPVRPSASQTPSPQSAPIKSSPSSGAPAASKLTSILESLTTKANTPTTTKTSQQTNSNNDLNKKKPVLRNLESDGQSNPTNGMTTQLSTPSTSPPPPPTQTNSNHLAIKTSTKKSDNVATNARRFIRITGHKNYVYCVCFDRTGKYIFTGSDDRLIKIWRVSDGMLVYTLRGHQKEVSDFHINYENTLLVSAGNDYKVLVWNIKTGQIVYITVQHCQLISRVQFSPKCDDKFRWFISTGHDGYITFNKYSPSPLNSDFYDFLPPVVFREKSQVTSSSFSKGGSLLVLGKKDGTVVIFLMSKNEPERVCEIKAHDEVITSLCFASHSLSFLTGSKDGRMNVWSIRNKRWAPTKIELEPLVTHGPKAVCNEVAWTCNDKFVMASICWEKCKNKIKVWTPEGKLKHELIFHIDQVFNLKPHPITPHILLTVARDGFAVLWNLNTGENIFRDFNESGGEYRWLLDASWSPNQGERFVTIDSVGHLSIFGFGETPDEYKSTPLEMFFNTDYDKLSRERNTIIDQRTKLPPHLMPYGYLTDVNGAPHPIEVQRRVPGRENLTETDFAARVVQIDGQSRIDDGLGEIPFQSANLCIKHLIDPLPNDLLESSENIRLANIRDEEEMIKNELKDLIQEGESSSKKRRVNLEERGANGTLGGGGYDSDSGESNKRTKC